jgi:hypothetical protein
MLSPYQRSELVNSHFLFVEILSARPCLENVHLKKKTADVKLQTQSLYK